MKYSIMLLICLFLLGGCSGAAPAAQDNSSMLATSAAQQPAAADPSEPPSITALPITIAETTIPTNIAEPEKAITPTVQQLGLLSPAEAEKIIAPTAQQAILALKNRDMNQLAQLVDPEKGVVFAPYGFVQASSLVLKADQLADALTDPTIHTWGSYDGSGEPIDLTFEAYYSRFVYSHDFAQAEQIGYNRVIGGAYTPDMFDANSIMVEYHFPGFDPKYEGMDWQSLRLVFEQKDQRWYLVGIIHDQWTI